MGIYSKFVCLLIAAAGFPTLAQYNQTEDVYRHIEGAHGWLKDSSIPLRKMTPLQLCEALSTVVPTIAHDMYSAKGDYDTNKIAEQFPDLALACRASQNLYANACINSVGRANSVNDFKTVVYSCADVWNISQVNCVESHAALAKFALFEIRECL
jgi:hypothetical protein